MIDIYRGSPAIYVFPSRDELPGLLPQGIADARFEPSDGYDLAECCPMLTLRKPS
jgi:hypothetical protein